jgi:methylmalonyl-CoA/ethylmalonyl-CoA epimerase
MGSHETQPAVEIIYEGTEAGPIDKLMQRHAQGIVYHVCYVTENLRESLDGLEAAGLRAVCVSPPKPALLFEGRKVSFYNIVGIGLIEILE